MIKDGQNYGSLFSSSNSRSGGVNNNSFLLETKPNESIEFKKSSSHTSLSSIISTDIIKSDRDLNKSLLMVNYSICFKNSCLVINLISLENVKSTSNNSQLCVYVKVEVFFLETNNNEQKQLIQLAKTRMIRNRSNPVYDEIFEFKSKLDQLDEIRLVFSICNSNSYGRDQLIGTKEHLIDKKEMQSMINSEPFLFRMYSQCLNILDSNENFQLGQLQLCLLYKKQKKILSVHLLKAINLKMPLNFSNNNKIPSIHFNFNNI